jgi:RimJ/RimL family protein N-acetyltransferase
MFWQRLCAAIPRHCNSYPQLTDRMEEATIREFAGRRDYELMLNYFYDADDDFLAGMGVDRQKLPPRGQWLSALLSDHEKSDGDRDRFYLLWQFVGRPVGHSSLSNIILGKEAHIHLHLWVAELRNADLGTAFVRRSIGFYWHRFRLTRLICEPWAENPAPNGLLRKLGFTFVKRYRTTPGPITYEQDVNRYELRHELP